MELHWKSEERYLFVPEETLFQFATTFHDL
jgi:hypothetical protein